MNFWSSPENNPFKIVLLILVLIIAGYFTYKYLHTNALSGKGQVVNTVGSVSPNGTPASSTPSNFTFKTTITGNTCTLTVCSTANTSECIPLDGVPAKDGSCTLDKVQFAPYAQDLLSIISPTTTAQ